MKNNVLVTGGFGFIGSRIVKALSNKEECEVTVVDIRAPNKDEKPRISFMQADIFDSDGLKKILHDRKITSVIHMVGLASIPDCKKNPDLSFRLNLSSVHHILEAMRLSDVKHLIFPSTAAVYGVTNGPKVNENAVPKPNNIYGCHKLGAETLIRGYMENYGIDATIMRIFNVYGDLNSEQGVTSLFIRGAMANKPLIVSGGEQIRDFVYLDDVVKAFAKSLNSPNVSQKTINVGSGVGVSIKEVAEMVRQGFPSVKVDHKPPNASEYSVYADNSQLRTLLGLDPIDPRVGIPRFIKACKIKCGTTEEPSSQQ